MGRDIWVEFNDLDKDGRVLAYIDSAEPGVDLSPGSQVVVGDDEGNTATATVIARQPVPDLPDQLTLQVDLTTFTPARSDTDVPPSG